MGLGFGHGLGLDNFLSDKKEYKRKVFMTNIMTGNFCYTMNTNLNSNDKILILLIAQRKTHSGNFYKCKKPLILYNVFYDITTLG